MRQHGYWNHSHHFPLLDDVFIPVRILQEELGVQVALCYRFMVNDSQGANTRQDQVLGNFIGKGLDCDQEDIRRSDSGGDWSIIILLKVFYEELRLLTSLGLACPITGSGGHTKRFHLD